MPPSIPQQIQKREPAWSVTILRVRGIPIRLHFTFFLLLAWVGLEGEPSARQAALNIVFLLVLFGSVLLHELGHALVAQRLKIPTRDITLYPFGGIATLAREGPPKAELLIAAAGPVVSFLLAAACSPFLPESIELPLDAPGGLISRVFIANMAIAIFNLLPAFPMDGGRILRASLALGGSAKATTIASRLSQVLSILLGLFAFATGNFMLVVIAALVFVNALQEHLRERARIAAEGCIVADVMAPLEGLQTFSHGTTLATALATALRSLQPSFPVVHNSEVIGVISRETILKVGATDPEESYLSGLMSRTFSTLNSDTPLTEALQLFPESEGDSLMVVDQGKLVGMLVKERVLEYLLVQEFKRKAAHRRGRSSQRG